jgi:hypothetical protein
MLRDKYHKSNVCSDRLYEFDPEPGSISPSKIQPLYDLFKNKNNKNDKAFSNSISKAQMI